MINNKSNIALNLKIDFKTSDLESLYNSTKYDNPLRIEEITLKKTSNWAVYTIIDSTIVSFDEQDFIDSVQLDEYFKGYTKPFCTTFCINFVGISKVLILYLRSSNENTNYTTTIYPGLITPKFFRNSSLHSGIHFFSIDLYKYRTNPTDSRTFLKRYLEYYNYLLNELEENKNVEFMEVNLPLFRTQPEFLNLGSDEGVLIIPVIGKVTRIRSIAIETVDNNDIKNTTSLKDVSTGSLDKEETEKFVDILKDQGVKLPKSVSLCLITLNEVASDRNTILSNLLNQSITKCRICEDTQGEKTRTKRVIKSIRKIMDNKCANTDLINIICCNDIVSYYSNLNIDFKPDIEYGKYLSCKHPILRDNEDQRIAIEKVVNMSKCNIPIMLVQGPPGTGKTELILALTKELSNSKKNVLITSNVHVACDNVMDRSKNDKELIFKRYTTLFNQEKYNQEVYQNQKRYFLNQVLTGFKFNDRVISSEAENANIQHDLDSLKFDISQMEKKYSYQHKIYEEYFNLEIELSKIASKLEEVEDSKKNIEMKLSVAKSEMQNLYQTYESTKSTVTQLSEASRTLTIRKLQLLLQKKSVSDNINRTQDAKELLTKNINLLSEKIRKRDAVLKNLWSKHLKDHNTLDEVISINIKKELSNVVEKLESKSPIESKLTSFYCDEMHQLQSFAKTREFLSEDNEFWVLNQLSSKFIAQLWFNKNNIYLVDADFDVYRCLEILYEHSKFSKSKKLAFKLFGDSNFNFSNSDVLKSQKLILHYLKSIQFDYKLIISRLFDSLFADEKMLYLLDQHKKIVSLNEYKIDKLNLEITSYRASIERLDNEYKVVTEEGIYYKNKLREIINTYTALLPETNKAILNLNLFSEKIADQKAKISSLDEIIFEMEQNLIRLKNQEVGYLQERQTLEQRKDAESNFHGSSLREFLVFQKKYFVEIQNKKEAYYHLEEFVNTLQRKFELLKAHDLNIDNSNLLFDYIKELSLLEKKDEEELKSVFSGKGNVFSDTFKIENNTDGVIISMTTNQVAQLLDKDPTFKFDYAIIDESSKCSFEDIIISLPNVKHLVLIGDYMQLDPQFDVFDSISIKKRNLIQNETTWIRMNKSPFSMLLEQVINFNFNNGIGSYESNPMVSVMKKQYRMNKGIYDLVSPIYSIHNGFQIEDVKNKQTSDLICIDIKGEEEEVNTSFKNTDEVNLTINLLLYIEKNRKLFPHINSIGVITGYKKQSSEIRKSLNKHINKKIKGLEIGTIDNFQGREYDLVILSIVRTRGLGFLKDVRRMNVAISRAKNHLVIIGNFEKINTVAMRERVYRNSEIILSNQEEIERKYVLTNLIPSLHRLKETYLSDEHRISAINNILLENNYE